MRIQECADPWDNVQPREGDGRTNAQSSIKSLAKSTGGNVGFIGFRESAARPLVEGLASFGRVKLAR